MQLETCLPSGIGPFRSISKIQWIESHGMDTGFSALILTFMPVICFTSKSPSKELLVPPPHLHSCLTPQTRLPDGGTCDQATTNAEALGRLRVSQPCRKPGATPCFPPCRSHGRPPIQTSSPPTEGAGCKVASEKSFVCSPTSVFRGVGGGREDAGQGVVGSIPNIMQVLGGPMPVTASVSSNAFSHESRHCEVQDQKALDNVLVMSSG